MESVLAGAPTVGTVVDDMELGVVDDTAHFPPNTSTKT